MITHWDQLPLVLRVTDLAALLGITTNGVYERVRLRPRSVPPWFNDSPYQWSRDVVKKWIEAPTVVGRRRVA